MKDNIKTLDWPELIASTPCAGFVPNALGALGQRVDAEAGTNLFRIGEAVRYVYLVVRGEARLIRRTIHGQEIILQRSRCGFIAEASLETKSYHCDAIAAEPTTLLQFPVGAFRSALDDEPMFCRGWQSLLAKEVRKLRAQCERLSLSRAADRINHYIESEGSNGVVSLTQTKKAWASELGLSHEALYRALRKMQDKNLLRVDGNQLISNPVPGR
ncbi:Crp/Fnr family transcriptional regulator [Rhodoferax mekongensis]|uniref:Crp/Fnr family transcriptional regulator n=1 Tax=Rhodoferax mekongensis TaxID=3068341 RepID=UPI0028BF11A7|nr:Crp/Fnr family transcriptional regulator [Rhodoferax sp. TBRC 17199]MDT7517074.1 Crp/Fnr family transcriptional regulator [Rhodoferax sp. TBRC 17199]